ncbi:hypothetical protein [Streptomyces collinus]|uniref:hypothetical protein n=1 Tax=Streptomyces collinus TaxID=42684 RepID=UPI003436D555
MLEAAWDTWLEVGSPSLYTLPPAPTPCTVGPAPRPVGDEVPPQLLALVTRHCRRSAAPPGLTVREARRVTCGDCVTTWNTRWPGQFAFPVALPAAAHPVDCRIGEQPPYASITRLGDGAETEEATAARAAAED